MTNANLESILGAKTISFNATFAKMTGSVTAAVFLSQALFWQVKAKFKTGEMEFEGESYFSKTGAEWFEETGLSAEQQKTARKPLVAAGILKERRAGLPAKMYFRVDIEALVSGFSAYLNTGVTVSGFSGNKKTENPRTGSGKFRKHEAGNSGSNIIVESFESSESGGERITHPFAHVGSIELPETNIPLEAEKEKAPPSSGPTPPPELIVTTVTPQAPYIRLVEKVETGETPGPKTPGEKIRELCEANFRIKEVFAMRGKIPISKFDEYLAAFDAEKTGLPVPQTWKNDNDLVQNFWAWSEIRYSKEQRNTPGPQRNGRGAQIVNSGGDRSKYEEVQKF